MASNPHCAKLVSQLQTNSYNFDEAVALKEGFILYILPEIQEIVLASVGDQYLFYTALVRHFYNRAILEMMLLL